MRPDLVTLSGVQVPADRCCPLARGDMKPGSRIRQAVPPAIHAHAPRTPGSDEAVMMVRFGAARAFRIEIERRELFARLPGNLEIYAWWDGTSAWRLRGLSDGVDLEVGRLRLCVARLRPPAAAAINPAP
jgi:hypothetical protein